MRYRGYTFFLFLCLSTLGQAQFRVEGRVLDNANGQPLAGASVYINHTTVGTTTGADGSFVLHGIDAGFYELVVSYVGYERILYEMSLKSKDLRVSFRMDTRVAQMRDILVVSPSTRKQWLDIFRQQFLGTTAAAESTRILNEEDIFFAKTGNENVISAFADVPLVIENRALGYRVYFELLTFEYNRSTTKCSFFGYNHFEQLLEEGVKAGRYEIPREDVYKGSTMHFFHALRANRLREEGFSIRTVLPASEGRRSAKSQAEEGVGASDVFVAGQSYPASRKNILFTDTTVQQDYLLWKGALEVTHQASTDANYGLIQSGDADLGTRSGMVSYIFIDTPPVYILDDGMPMDPRSIRFGGHWSMERVANMLPQDYRPDRKSLFNKKRL